MPLITQAIARWNLTSTAAGEARRRLAVRHGQSGQIDWGRLSVAHIDTGVRNHPIFGGFGGNSWVMAGRGVNYVEPGHLPVEPRHRPGRTDQSSLPGRLVRFITDVSAKDSDGHGTRTLSVLCGDWRAPGALTWVGVAPRLPVVPYRISDTILLAGSEVARHLAEAVRHGVASGCQVINISLGWPFRLSDDVERAVDWAYERGVIIVAAAGQIIDRVSYPGKLARTIAVGGHRPDGRVWATYSPTQSRFIDIWAPSSRIVRAKAERVQGAWGLDFLGGTGTSYAAVHVSAAAAYWLRYHGAGLIGAAYPEPWQRVEAFRALLKANGAPLLAPRSRPDLRGHRRLNIDKLMSAALPHRSDLQRA